MAVAPMLYIVDALEKFRHRTRGRIGRVYFERNAALVDGLVEEHRDCAGHGEAKALEEGLRRAFGVVVDSEVYLCHDACSPSAGYDIKNVLSASIIRYTDLKLRQYPKTVGTAFHRRPRSPMERRPYHVG